ncbi:MAG: FecR domain-containing protein, partial [Halothiobacillus sp.]|nr:FecR domain-containing protein [Halothiobacillus sp.]
MSCDLPITSMLGKRQTVLARLVKDIVVVLLVLVHMIWPTLRADDQPAQIAGEVIFVSHAAWMHSPGHPPVRLKEGDVILVGASLETAPDAQLHLKMIDKAFIALRPGSRLQIVDYRRPTPEDPQSGIKLQLIQGTLRSITGEIGESHKAHFRLNTPIAAIGIRGTDFSLKSTAASTQANVLSGAIVLSPFGALCARDALGPCSGDNSLVAHASTDTHVELRAGAERPTIAQTVPAELLPTPEEERSRRAATASSRPSSSSGAGVPFTVVAPAPQTAPAKEKDERRIQVVQDNRQAEQPLPAPRIDSTDPDGDGLDQEGERTAGTNPFSQDTDGDGMPDGLDPRPITTNLYATDQKTVQLTPKQLAAFRFHSIQIERPTRGDHPALIQRITLTQEETAGSDASASITVERRQDEEGRVFWGSAASFGLLEESLRADPSQAALSQELREALLEAGVSPENASHTALEWLNYHSTPPSTATITNATRYLVAAQGLERATTPLINQRYPSFNQFYALHTQDAARHRPDGTAEDLPVTDFQFKMNYADHTF